MVRLPSTVANGIPWDMSDLTDAKAVAAPESQVRLIFHVKGVAGDEVFGKTLSTVQFALSDDPGSFVSWREFRWKRVELCCLVAVIASFDSRGLVIEIENLLGFGGVGW